MPESVIRLDADVESITVKLKKVGDAQKKLGNDLAKHVDDSSKKLGGAFDITLKKMAGVVSVMGALKASIQALDTVQSKVTAQAKSANVQSIAAERAAMLVGGDQRANRQWINMKGSHNTTLESRTRFMEAIGAIQEERRARGLPGLSAESIRNMQNMYTKGGNEIFDENGADIISAAKEFPMAPQVGISRRLSGRLGRRVRPENINGAIDELRGRAAWQTAEAYDAREYQDAVDTENYRLGIQPGRQQIGARSIEAQRWAQDHPFKDALFPEWALGKPDKYMGDEATKHLRDISETTRRSHLQTTPVLPNMSARQEPRK